MPWWCFFDHIWSKVNSFSSRGHHMKSYRSSRTWFLIDNVFYMRVETVRIVHFLTLKYQFRVLNSGQVRSGQGQVFTEVDQYAYIPKHLDELSRLALFVHLYLHPVASYWRKKDCGLMWPQMTFPWPPIISCTRIITGWVSGYDPERTGGFRLVYAKRGKHFRISPRGYTIEAMKLTWPWVTRIKIPRHTFNRYWWPHAIL